jgi:hypothetical protein
MRQSTRLMLAAALLGIAAPAFAQGTATTTPASPAAPMARPATPANPGGAVTQAAPTPRRDGAAPTQGQATRPAVPATPAAPATRTN